MDVPSDIHSQLAVTVPPMSEQVAEQSFGPTVKLSQDAVGVTDGGMEGKGPWLAEVDDAVVRIGEAPVVCDMLPDDAPLLV